MLKQAIIAAGGLSNRMRGATNAPSKCLSDVDGKPILKYILDRLVDVGVTKVIIATNDVTYNHIKQYVNREYVDNYPGLEVDCSSSPSLGVGYSIYCTRDLVNMNVPTLITVADLICLDGYHSFNLALKDSDLVLATSNENLLQGKNYNLASVNSSGRLLLNNQPTNVDNSGRALLGIYALKTLDGFFKYLSSSIESVIQETISSNDAFNSNIINAKGEYRLSYVFDYLNLNNYKAILINQDSCFEVNEPKDLQKLSQIVQNFSF